MKKNIVFFILIFLVLGACFASDSYSLNIKNADMVRVHGSSIILSGNINLEFTTEKNEKYILTSQKVNIDTDNNVIDASGSVVLTKANGSESFKGEVVSLNWKKLDIKVFDGTSRSERKNASQNTVNFYSQGQSISYAGQGDTVVFENGIVSTKGEKTNWSIDASKIELLGSDMFFRNATLKIGRVPILWIPVFYYPGSKLGFNPAVGITTRNGQEVSFINTTTEIYGSYSMNSSSSSVKESDADAVAGSVLSLLQKNENKVYVRDGLLYKEYDAKDELPKLQQWAKDTSSFFAFTADAYSDRGLALGYDTKNKFKNGNITLTSKGLFAFDPSKEEGKNIRYVNDLSLNVKHKNLSLSLTVPFISDKSVKKDYYNRVNNFSIDSIFGTKQNIPSSYSSEITNYTMSLNGSYSKTLGRFSFSLSSLKANINFKEKTSSAKDGKTNLFGEYEIYSMSLPNLSFSSNGSIIDWSSKSTTKTVENEIKNKTAKAFKEELSTLEEGAEPQPEALIKAPELSSTKTSEISGAQFKMSYNLSYNLDNFYQQNTNLADDDKFLSTLSSKLNGTVSFSGKAPGNWFSFSDTLTPSYNFSVNTGNTKTHATSLNNSFSAKSSKFGLSYSLNQKLYSKTVTIPEIGKITETEFKGKFDKDSITAHSLSFSRSLGVLSFGLSSTLKPLTESLSPNFSLSKSGFTVKGDFSMKRAQNEEKFTKNKSNLNFSYNYKIFSSYMNNTYDFAKDSWDGLTTAARAQFAFSKPSLTVYSLLKTQKDFKPVSMETGLNFKGNTAVVTFKNEKLELDNFNINLKYSFPAKYFWKNRVGLESSMSTSFNYDFDNKYATSLDFNFSLGFSISKFMNLNFSIKSTNNSFYNYFDKETGEIFSVPEVFKDLAKSFDIIGGGNRDTNFNINSFTLSFVHYMEDWNLYVDGTGSISNDTNGYRFNTEYSVYVKWNIIPEIKAENTYNDGLWEKQ